jgi:hypothetical protein
MHNRVAFAPGIKLQTLRRRRSIALLLAAVWLSTACVPREHDAGSVARLTMGEPVFKEYKGANIYLLRREDNTVTVFWGMSPIEPSGPEKIRCFIQDRRDRTFRGETRPFIDPCHSAWWSRDGHFLGYSSDPAGAPATGPDLIRIPAEVRDGRVVLDEARLRCLQTRGCTE